MKYTDHGAMWKHIALQVGCNGKRCYDSKVENNFRYTYECPQCKRETGRHRKMRIDSACGSCCKEFNRGKFSSDYILTLKLIN